MVYNNNADEKNKEKIRIKLNHSSLKDKEKAALELLKRKNMLFN